MKGVESELKFLLVTRLNKNWQQKQAKKNTEKKRIKIKSVLFCYSWTDVWNTDQELDSLWDALTGAQGALEPQYLSGKDRGVQGL